MPTARVNGIDIYYEECGSGPDLIVAHGLMGSVALAPQFGERYDAIAEQGVHVIAYDARGHGHSGYTTDVRDYSWQSLADDLYVLIRTLGLQSASIYGGSMGAGTALVLAMEHPESVEKLILRAPPPTGSDLDKIRRMFGGIATLYRLFGVDLTARMIAALPPSTRDERAVKFDRRAFFAAQRRQPVVPAIRGVLVDGTPLPVHRLHEVRQQTLIMTHPDDPIHPERSGELLHDRMPHAKLAAAPTATYWAEHPHALTHVIAAFVKGEPVAKDLPGAKILHEHG